MDEQMLGRAAGMSRIAAVPITQSSRILTVTGELSASDAEPLPWTWISSGAQLASAFSVTWLVVLDAGQDFALFGQIVIVCLILTMTLCASRRR